MNRTILHTLYTGDKYQAYKTIIQQYQTHGHAVVNFLYFANAMHQRVLEDPLNKRQSDYHQALLASSILMPDGIALQLFYKRFSTITPKYSLHNLNGTDFTPFFIDQLLKEYENVHISLRNLYDPKIKKDKIRLDKAKDTFRRLHGHDIDYAHQCLYDQREEGRDRKQYEQSITNHTDSIRILINCTGSPFQEIRAEQNREKLNQHHIIVINAGGYVDFLSGFEQRAPQRLINIRVGETLWRIARNPRKNLKKLLRMMQIGRLFLPSFSKNQE